MTVHNHANLRYATQDPIKHLKDMQFLAELHRPKRDPDDKTRSVFRACVGVKTDKRAGILGGKHRKWLLATFCWSHWQLLCGFRKRMSSSLRKDILFQELASV